MVAFFSAAIATRFELHELPREVAITIRNGARFHLNFAHRYQNLVPDYLDLGWVAFWGISLKRRNLKMQLRQDGKMVRPRRGIEY